MGTLLPMLLVAFLVGPEGARLILGQQKSRFVVRPAKQALEVFAYANNGYAQRIIPGDNVFYVDVEVRNSQLSSKMLGRHVTGLPAELDDLTAALNQAADGYLADQVGILIDWLGREISYDTQTNRDQSLSAILASRRADCVGLASLAIHVLETMGVNARYVTGVTYKRGDRVKLLLEGNVLHRWIEVQYDDVGWVFCDPAGKVNFVEATYMVLGVQDHHPLPSILQNAVGSRVEILEFNNGFQTVGAVPGATSNLVIRPNRLFANP